MGHQSGLIGLGLALLYTAASAQQPSPTLQDFTQECVAGRTTCGTFKDCCEEKRCDPGIYLLFRCAKKAGAFNPDLSYCKCSQTRPAPPASNSAFPNYTQECLDRPGVSTCADFERCCARRTCQAGVERRYECGYYNHNMAIQRSKALCLCQSPTGGAVGTVSSHRLALLLLLVPFFLLTPPGPS